jgi:hypothetical protein
MNDLQTDLCKKHRVLLDLIWRFGFGIALQPQLTDLVVYLNYYPSEQMCRRGIRDLKAARLLKVKRWQDGRSEILILCKPAISYITGRTSEQITSIPPYSAHKPEWASIFRLWYLKRQLLRYNGLPSYQIVLSSLDQAQISLFCRLSELPDYWLKRKDFYARLSQDCRNYQLQLDAMNYWKQPFHPVGNQRLTRITTLRTLHQHGLFLIGYSHDPKAEPLHQHRLRFGYFFSNDSLNAKTAVELAVLCHEWAKLISDQLEVQLDVFCLNEIQAGTLKRQLLKTETGREFWRVKANRRFDGYPRCPIVPVDTGLQTLYLKKIPL